MSAFDDVPAHIKDSAFQDIAEQLLDNWFDEILDEGEYYADMQVATMCNDSTMKESFNTFYNLKPGDKDYLS